MNENNQKTSPDTTDSKQDELLSRRAVLRGALMVGCSLFVPAIFSSSANGADSKAPAAAKKQSKKSVKYQNQPMGEKKCSTCMNFIAASNTCKLVEGHINPNGYCILWAKKA